MARKQIIISEDDLTGGPATELVHFALDGVSYEIDLNGDNASALRYALQPYVTSGRRTNRAAERGATIGRRNSAAHLTEVRQWARDHGHAVSDRGRVAQSVMDAYQAATASH